MDYTEVAGDNAVIKLPSYGASCVVICACNCVLPMQTLPRPQPIASSAW